jgi:hypothetical protein
MSETIIPKYNISTLKNKYQAPNNKQITILNDRMTKNISTKFKFIVLVIGISVIGVYLLFEICNLEFY